MLGLDISRDLADGPSGLVIVPNLDNKRVRFVAVAELRAVQRDAVIDSRAPTLCAFAPCSVRRIWQTVSPVLAFRIKSEVGRIASFVHDICPVGIDAATTECL